MARSALQRISSRVAAGLVALLGVGLAVPVLAGGGVTSSPAVEGATRACAASVTTTITQPTAAQLAAAGLGRLRLAPDRKRVDLVAPPFSEPTTVTNPLFPIGNLHSAILNGHLGSTPLKIETTLLPETRIVEWSPGQCVRTLISQFVAYLDGRIEEVAIDRYAQADDGSVWYFGEDVFDYKDGSVADRAGTWLAGRDGPAAMIMPGNPTVGSVMRTENVPGLVFEEVTVKRTGVTVTGPRGQARGAMVGSELHDDGTREDKVFGPGYGEFRSATRADLEALALAVPTDAVAGRMPAALTRLFSGAITSFDAAGSGRWSAASRAVEQITAAWRAHRARGVPPRLAAPTSRALRALARAVEARARRRGRDAALAVAQATLDLQLQYRPVTEIDRARFDLWTRRVIVDAAARDLPAVNGDVSTLAWIRDRIARSLDSVDVARIDATLSELQANVGDGDLGAASRTAVTLRHALARARAAR